LKADDEERRRRNDDLKLKIALERSVTEGSPDVVHSQVNKFFSQIFTKTEPFLSFQGFDFSGNSNIFDSNIHTDPYLPPTTSNHSWNQPNTRPSTHLGFTTSTSIIITR
jgi:hypothetical protein